jgi:3D (Asp-Asp-Asp) domain-containing protein
VTGPPTSTALTVTIIADGQECSLSSEPVTVGELLSRAGVALSLLDRVEPGLETPVTAGMAVRVARVTRERVRREIEISVETTVRLDERVHPPVVLHEGAPGRAVEVMEVWRRDGAETRRMLISRHVVKQMRPRVVVRASAPLPSRGGDMLYMVATGYDPGPRSCGRWASGRTAIGLHAGRGVVAVDPRVIPLGTRLYVEGYGNCIAGDVGSAIKGRRIDLGFDSYREAMRWGRRTVRVVVLQ